MKSLVEHDVGTLAAELVGAGEKASHARRVLRAFYLADGAPDWGAVEMNRSLRALLVGFSGESLGGLSGDSSGDLAGSGRGRASRVLDCRRSADGTVKLLIGFGTESAEAVLMPAYRADRAAGCVSSQIGCAMGCDFCASTRLGLVRNLTSGEIVEQFLHLRRQAAAIGRRISSLVFMGMGEPMHNLEQVIAAIRRIADPDMGGLGWRQITVSTVGIVPGIDALAEADLNVHLALSLHAPDDVTRSRIVPAGRRYGVAEILAATRRFAMKTGRIPTIEYCLLAGVNDSDAAAELLGRLLMDPLTGVRAHVNLIPYNAIGAGLSGTRYARPTRERMESFAGVLSARGVVSHFRRTRGDDVNAACGQLRQRAMVHALPVLGE